MVTVLAFGDQPELYGLPANPTVPRLVTFWKGAMKNIGNTVLIAGIFGAALHFIRYGRKHKDAGQTPPGEDPTFPRQTPGGQPPD